MSAPAKAKLSDGDYLTSVVRINAHRYHVRSASRASSVREVTVGVDGKLRCSCPARTPYCKHRTAVESYIEDCQRPIEITIVCGCVGCRKVNPNPYGCIYRAQANDYQAVIGF